VGKTNVVQKSTMELPCEDGEDKDGWKPAKQYHI